MRMGACLFQDSGIHAAILPCCCQIWWAVCPYLLYPGVQSIPVHLPGSSMHDISRGNCAPT